MNTPIICDYGSAFSKVGFAGTDQPRSIFPTILGKFRYDYPKVGLDKEDCFIGREAQDKRSQLSLQSPISRGVIVNWDDMEKILFETFNVPALNLSNQGVLSLFASGYTSGTIIESGEGMTYFVPIIEGCPLHLSTLKTDVAGQDLTLYLLKLLSKGRNVLVGTVDQECIRQMKEKCCYVALNFEKEKGNLDPCTKKFQLPDGEEITLGQERFFCPEALFQADLIEKNSLGIHMWAYKAISSCCPSLWKVLFSHILLSGGTGSCNGLQQRLQREMSELVSPTLVVKVSTCPFSRYGAWIGGSILASLSSFENMWITDKEYKENGLSIIRRRSY
ncbi:actin, alpha skeletal muscle 2-like isoform X3 [Erinaceus europaeus]|uniref:Actin, alpha skeletal muscle 2-like isoform X3 n=1 Tax=Erinaceus europaeus TaxID=9365 RepID=A0ABM3W6H2_ERIEU|nr:actin, alpha skeletal muscle 2-like isoform X3 [Erinaceus europaeus]